MTRASDGEVPSPFPHLQITPCRHLRRSEHLKINVSLLTNGNVHTMDANVDRLHPACHSTCALHAVCMSSDMQDACILLVAVMRARFDSSTNEATGKITKVKLYFSVC